MTTKLADETLQEYLHIKIIYFQREINVIAAVS